MPVKLPENFLSPGFIPSQTNTKQEQLSGSGQHSKPNTVFKSSTTRAHSGVHFYPNDSHHSTPDCNR